MARWKTFVGSVLPSELCFARVAASCAGATNIETQLRLLPSAPREIEMVVASSCARTHEDKQVTFDKAGRVDVFCSTHANMHCIVLVLDNPYFAIAEKNQRMPPQTKEITVPASGEVKADFVLGITGLPQY